MSRDFSPIEDILYAAAICTAAFAISFTLFTPTFQTNDDPVMMLIAAGAYGAGPRPLLIHSHVLVGWIISGLFSLSNTVNWYSLYLYAIHALSACVLLHCFTRWLGRTAGTVAWMLIFVLWILPFLVQLQFTTTTWMAGVASISIASSAPRTNTRALAATRALSIFLMTLGAMVRSYGLGLLVPITVATVYRHRGSPYLPALAVTLTLAFLSAGAAILSNRIPYRLDSQWDHYTEYAGLRVNYDRANFNNPAINDILPKAGWSRNDYQVLRAGLDVDAEAFSIAQLRTLKEEAARLSWPPGELSRRLTDEARRYAPDFGIAILCALALATMPRRNPREGIAVTLLVAAITITMAAVLLAWIKLPRRVMEPLLMGIALAPTFLPMDTALDRCKRDCPHSRHVARNAVLGVFFLALCALAIQSAVSLRKTSRWYEGRNAKITAWMDAVLADPARRDAVYISRGFPLTWLPVFEGPEKVLRVNLIQAGWTTQTPMYNRKLASWGIHDVYSALLDRPNTYLVVSPQLERVVSEYYREHHDTIVQLNEIDRLHAGPNSDVAVYQIARIGNRETD